MYGDDAARDGNVPLSNREWTYPIYHLASTPNVAKAGSSAANGTLSTSACATSIRSEGTLWSQAPGRRGDHARVNYRGRGAPKGQLVIGLEFFKPLSDEEYGIGSESGSA